MQDTNEIDGQSNRMRGVGGGVGELDELGD